MPAGLPEMMQLETLAAVPPFDERLPGGLPEQAADWHAALGAALDQLTRLTALMVGEHTAPSNLVAAQLPRLQRLWFATSPIPRPDALAGPWLGSLRWLGMQWLQLECSVEPLRAAAHLEKLCSLGMPACTNEGHWRAAWDFLATHPPLKCFCIETYESPTLPLVDALIALNNRRPALHVRRTAPIASLSAYA